ncbi:2TM domain-containing protein [Flavobacterium urocaniciphilum]|uniref:2TM domain-containing protein n=2 Tax=Flavobacterium urocaniciphilum TaxID=1299341 RepID=A0A1H8YYI5_9FLAO|nr:2TM domain-containing protein [Flavobacterium urocaniciphilum]
METNNQEYERYQAAKKRVKEIKGFYGNLVSYILVISFLTFINLKYTPEHLWFYWPMLGWGIGLLFHAFGVFNIVPFFGKDWEEKKIKELMEEENKQKDKFQ